MPVTLDFKNAVHDKNVRRVRIMMKDSLIRDPSFAEFGRTLTSSDPSDFPKQLIVLLAGILIYIVTWFLTFRRAARQFEKYDL